MPPDLLVQFKNPVKRPVETPYGGFLFRCYSRALPLNVQSLPPALYPLLLVPSPGLGKDQGQRSAGAQCSVARLSMMELNSAGRKRSLGVRFGHTLRMSAGRSLSGPPPRAGPMIQVGTFSRVHSGYIFRA